MTHEEMRRRLLRHVARKEADAARQFPQTREWIERLVCLECLDGELVRECGCAAQQMKAR